MMSDVVVFTILQALISAAAVLLGFMVATLLHWWANLCCQVWGKMTGNQGGDDE